MESVVVGSYRYNIQAQIWHFTALVRPPNWGVGTVCCLVVHFTGYHATTVMYNQSRKSSISNRFMLDMAFIKNHKEFSSPLKSHYKQFWHTLQFHWSSCMRALTLDIITSYNIQGLIFFFKTNSKKNVYIFIYLCCSTC